MSITNRSINFKTSPSGLLVPTAVDNPTLGAVDVTIEIATPADVSKVLRGNGTWAQIADAQIASGAAIGIAKLAGYPADGTKVLKGDATWGAPPSGSPSGAAGGDLTGTFPNPTLAAAGPGATGPIGSSTLIPIITIDAKGRVTALSSVTPAAGAASITVATSDPGSPVAGTAYFNSTSRKLSVYDGTRWNRVVLTADTIYQATVLADTPLGYWRLGEASGNPADSSGNAFTMTASGTITYGVASLLPSETDKAISLAGAGSFASAGVTATSGDLTVEAWISHAAIAATAMKIAAQGSTTTGWGAGVGATGAWNFQTFGHTTFTFSTSPARDGATVYHVVFVWNNTTKLLSLYVNGVFAESGTLGTGMNASSGSTRIGANNAGGELWQGKLDEVAVYHSQLSATRIAAHYAAR